MDKTNGKKNLKFSQLLSKAEELVGKTISPLTALKFIEVGNLPETTEYTPHEAEQFFSVCDKVLNQGMSLAQVQQAQAVEASGESAQKKSQGLTEELAQSMLMMESEIFLQFPLIVQQKMEALLAGPGLLEEIFAESRRRILKAEADGISSEEEYCAWMNDREMILAQIRRRLSKKRKR